MAIERETVVQVVVSVLAVALFIAALVGLSLVYGAQSPIENEQVEGSLTGQITDVERTDGTVEGTLDGEFSNSFEASMDGEVSGTVTDGVLTGTFDGTVSGAVEGTATGDLNGTLDESGSFDGTFSGTVNGTDHDTDISPDGGLVLIGLLALFIVVMPIFGYFIERQSE